MCVYMYGNEAGVERAAAHQHQETISTRDDDDEDAAGKKWEAEPR